MAIDPGALLAEGVAALNAAKVAAKDQPVWLPAISTMLASVTNASITAVSGVIAAAVSTLSSAISVPNPSTGIITAAITAATGQILGAASPTWPQAVALATSYGTEIIAFHRGIMNDATKTSAERSAAADRLCSILKLL